MSEAVYILGTYSTPFRRWPEKGFKELTREAYLGAVKDAGLVDPLLIEAAWFGNCVMHYWGQPMVRGNVSFIPLVREGLFRDRAPVINVEGACATGSLALNGAYKEIRAGDAEVTVAVGVEKLYDQKNPSAILPEFGKGADQLDPQEWIRHYSEIGERLDQPFEMSPDRSVAMDTYSMQARLHMKLYGTTSEQIAAACAKSHTNGSLNPLAQYRFAMTAQQVLDDRMVSNPLTRAMCAPVGDGAAAAVLCSERFLQTQPASVRERAVKIRALALSGGKYRGEREAGLSRAAADKAYKQAGISPDQVNLAEVHDATSFCEIYQTEMMRFCPDGQGGPFAVSGATAIDGKVAINPSGGLVSKGHPIGATGLSMCHEIVNQLRGEAGELQVRNARVGLQQNGGGIIGLEEAVCAVAIYER
ncbi:MULTISPECIES: thiolase family protein [Comamonadaceae]|uniref:thiolase family protein n=1 Tax=Comamonadaceae TaxID=80864 RepID=UPI0010F7A0F0|nr:MULTISPECIES: thiolase family protein [Comamonadaceae]